MKYFFHQLKDTYFRYRYAKRLLQISFDLPSEGIILNFGNVFSSGPGLIHGGKVKLLHLQEAFVENYNKFNILYLVSSAQPPYAEELVRWAKGQGVKLVWNQNGVGYPAWAGSQSEIHNLSMRKLIHKADFVIYQSRFCRISADRFLGPISGPSEIVNNCIDTDLFIPAPIPIPSTPWVLLAAGTHQQAERITLALETIVLLKERKKEVQLIIAGKLDWPDAEHEVQNLIEKFSIKEQITRFPPFNQKEAPELYRKAHVLLHLKYKDPCPTVCLEAMSCGLPVIGSNSGGMFELVGNDGGILIDVPESWDQMHYPTAEKLADTIESLFDDLSIWQEKARQRAVCHFEKKRWIERHQNIFQTVLK